MKKLSKALCLLLCGAISLSVSFGCSGGNAGTKGTLSIAIFEGGYGNTWGEALVSAYKKYNPDASVNVNCNPLVRDDAVTACQTGETSTDIFFIDGVNLGNYLEEYGTIADISELYNSTPKVGDKEENVLIKDKISLEIVEDMKYNGNRSSFADKYYLVPSASGPCSVILNVDALNNVLGEGNWTEPRTTDELMALADAIIEADKKVNIAGASVKVYPFIYSGSALEYWRYMYNTWIAQYGGMQVWNDLQSVKINGEYNQAAYQPEAKKIAYKGLEKIISRSNGYCDPSSMNNKFTQSQKYFFQGRACMFVCGDWLEREMENTTSYKSEFKMIRTPVISSLATKIEAEYGVSLGSTDAEKDEKLSRIIEAIDAGENVFDGVSSEVFNRVKEARSYTYTLANSQIGFVTECSVNKDMAIDFLRFMYSDEGLQIVLNETKSYIPTVNSSSFTSTQELSAFRKSVNVISRGDTTYIYSSSGDPIHYRAGLDCYVGNEYPEVAMGKKSGALTAEEYLAKEATLLNNQWADLMKNVG